MTLDERVVTEFAGGAGLGLTIDAGPAGVTRGPDGNVWFAESGLDGRMPPVRAARRRRSRWTSRCRRSARHTVTDGELQATDRRRTRRPRRYHVEYGPDTELRHAVGPESRIDGARGAAPVTLGDRTDTLPAELRIAFARLVATQRLGRQPRLRPTSAAVDGRGRAG